MPWLSEFVRSADLAQCSYQSLCVSSNNPPAMMHLGIHNTLTAGSLKRFATCCYPTIACTATSVSLLFGSAIPISLLINYTCFTIHTADCIAEVRQAHMTHGITSRTMSRGTMQWHPTFVQCWKLKLPPSQIAVIRTLW